MVSRGRSSIKMPKNMTPAMIVSAVLCLKGVCGGYLGRSKVTKVAFGEHMNLNS